MPARIFIISERRLAYDIRNGVSWLASHKSPKFAIRKLGGSEEYDVLMI